MKQDPVLHWQDHHPHDEISCFLDAVLPSSPLPNSLLPFCPHLPTLASSPAVSFAYSPNTIPHLLGYSSSLCPRIPEPTQVQVVMMEVVEVVEVATVVSSVLILMSE